MFWCRDGYAPLHFMIMFRLLPRKLEADDEWPSIFNHLIFPWSGCDQGKKRCEPRFLYAVCFEPAPEFSYGPFSWFWLSTFFRCGNSTLVIRCRIFREGECEYFKDLPSWWIAIFGILMLVVITRWWIMCNLFRTSQCQKIMFFFSFPLSVLHRSLCHTSSVIAEGFRENETRWETDFFPGRNGIWNSLVFHPQTYFVRYLRPSSVTFLHFSCERVNTRKLGKSKSELRNLSTQRWKWIILIPFPLPTNHQSQLFCRQILPAHSV